MKLSISFYFDYISGLCYGSSFDVHYSFTKEFSSNTEIYTFRGFKSSIIYYDADASEWRLSLYSKPSVFATYNGTDLYPFGSNDWYVYNDTCKDIIKYNKEVNIMNFNMNACDPETEFNCKDGTW